MAWAGQDSLSYLRFPGFRLLLWWDAFHSFSQSGTSKNQKWLVPAYQWTFTVIVLMIISGKLCYHRYDFQHPGLGLKEGEKALYVLFVIILQSLDTFSRSIKIAVAWSFTLTSSHKLFEEISSTPPTWKEVSSTCTANYNRETYLNTFEDWEKLLEKLFDGRKTVNIWYVLRK